MALGGKKRIEFNNLEELEGRAKQAISKVAFAYYSTGADDNITLAENRKAWRALRLVHRVFVNVDHISMACQVQGRTFRAPIMIAPMAMQCLAHPDGEIAVARAAASRGIPMVVSTVATYSVTEVAAVRPQPDLFFQLYLLRDREFMRQLVQTVESAGYLGLMVTVDAPILGSRETGNKERHKIPDDIHLKNLAGLGQPSDPTAKRQLRSQLELMELFANEIDASATWKTLDWLRTITSLPIWVKGVVSPEDAELAVSAGVHGIVCSNHGGRQLDTCISTADALPGVVKAVGGRVPVLVDGGIRRGTDVLKAMAMGASAVLLGRSVLYGLGLDGQSGVEAVIDKLIDELKRAMALSGCPSLKDINPSILTRANIHPSRL